MRQLTAEDLAMVYDNLPRGRQHLALLAQMAECNLPDLDQKTIGQMAVMAKAAAEVQEAEDQSPVEIPDEISRRKWGTAKSSERAPILERLAAIFRECDETVDRIAAMVPKPRELAGATAVDDPEPMPDAEYHDVPAQVTIRLAYPFTLDGLTVEEISLRPPSFGDVERVMAGAISELEMHARMSGVPVAALRAMRWPDVEAVMASARHLAPELRRQ